MMHRCSSGCGHGNMVGHCSCGGAAASSAAAFSMFLSMPNGNHTCRTSGFHNEDENMYSFASSPASVDCTLSLATPSTRRFNENNEKRGERRLSNFCWDILQPSKQPPPSSVHKSAAAAAESLVPRRCANCDTTSTPLWRNGPRGPKSLCNACGIRFKKEERRASAAAATATCAAAGGVGIEAQHMINTSWVHHHHHTQAQKMGYYSSAAYGNEFRFIDDDHRDADAGAIPFISWRLSNVGDRSSLVHDFTR